MNRSVLRSVLALTGLALLAAPLHANAQALTKVVLSNVYTVEKRYRSMEGPGSMTTVLLDEEAEPELMWITGVKTEMVGEDGKTAQLPELMCHVNVDIDPIKHQKLFSFKRATSSRLVTLSQGMLSMQAPKGFGFPLVSNEPVFLYTQVLNHNIENPGKIKVRHRLTFTYVRDRDLKTPLKPLFNLGASGMVLINENPLAIPTEVDAGGAHGASCLMAPRAPNALGTGSDYTDPAGRKLTGHWIVPPGKQTNHTDITWFMGLPYDTKLHYAAIHLHPYAESLTFRDVTTDKTIFTVSAKNPKGKVGLDHVDTFDSVEGVPLFKDHKYELISVYNNTSQETADSMASIFLGVLDPEFVRPTKKVLEARAAALFESTISDEVLLHMTAGAAGAVLKRDTAPDTVRQFLKLARAGLIDKARVTAGPDFGGAPSITFTVRVDEKQKKLLNTRLGIETRREHKPGDLSVCPEDNTENTFVFSFVMAPAPHRDGRCTAFAALGPGTEVLRKVYQSRSENGTVPAVTMTRAELFSASNTPTVWVAPAGM